MPDLPGAGVDARLPDLPDLRRGRANKGETHDRAGEQYSVSGVHERRSIYGAGGRQNLSAVPGVGADYPGGGENQSRFYPIDVAA